VPAIPSWLLEPLWDQFAALLPDRPVYDPAHPLGCRRPRIGDRVIFGKLVQVLRFGCSYEAIADCTCSATTVRERRSEWIKAGVFARLKQIALESCDRIVGLVLQEIAVDGCITKAPGSGECAGRSPVDRGKLGMKRSSMTGGYGIPLGRVLAPASRHDSPLLASTLDKLGELGPDTGSGRNAGRSSTTAWSPPPSPAAHGPLLPRVGTLQPRRQDTGRTTGHERSPHPMR
jgi:transposase